MKALAYLRVSTQEQSDHGISLESQVAQRLRLLPQSHSCPGVRPGRGGATIERRIRPAAIPAPRAVGPSVGPASTRNVVRLPNFGGSAF